MVYIFIILYINISIYMCILKTLYICILMYIFSFVSKKVSKIVSVFKTKNLYLIKDRGYLFTACSTIFGMLYSKDYFQYIEFINTNLYLIIIYISTFLYVSFIIYKYIICYHNFINPL